MLGGVGTDQGTGNQVDCQGTAQREGEQQPDPGPSGDRAGRLGQHHRDEVAADECRQEQQSGDGADPVTLRQGNRIGNLKRLLILLCGSLESCGEFNRAEEALCLGENQRIAARTGDVGAVDVALLNRDSGLRLIRIGSGVQREFTFNLAEHT